MLTISSIGFVIMLYFINAWVTFFAHTIKADGMQGAASRANAFVISALMGLPDNTQQQHADGKEQHADKNHNQCCDDKLN